MANVFDGRNVLQMAMDMEKTGEDFYRCLGGACDDVKAAALCRRLAETEANHYNVFRQIRDGLAKTGAPRPLPEDETEALHELVKAHVVPDPEAVRKVALGGNLKTALALAVQMERDSVHFYEQLLPSVTGDHVAAVKRIIAEEQQHVRSLLAQAV